MSNNQQTQASNAEQKAAEQKSTASANPNIAVNAQSSVSGVEAKTTSSANSATTSPSSTSTDDLLNSESEVIIEVKDAKTNNSENITPAFRGFDYESDFQIELQKRIPPVYILVVVLAVLSMFSGLVNDAFVPAIQEMSNDFNVPPSSIQKLVSLYLIGSGIGQLFWGPFMDRFGRKKLVVVTCLLGILTNFGFVMVPYDQP